MESPSSQYATAVVVGMGEMGGVFSRALLKSGHIVVPVTRNTDLDEASAAFPDPDVVLITVGESDLTDVLAALPPTWKRRAALLQNELLPRDWEAHGIVDPTVAVVWFEKKPGQDVKVIIPSPIGGPYAAQLSAALAAIDIPCTVVADAAELTAELVTKNVYILTVNIGGLTTGGSVSDLWNNHRPLATEVANEVLEVQAWLAGRELDAGRHMQGMEDAIAGDPEHKATGRSAPARLTRALHNAAQAGIETPRLQTIAADHIVDA